LSVKTNIVLATDGHGMKHTYQSTPPHFYMMFMNIQKG